MERFERLMVSIWAWCITGLAKAKAFAGQTASRAATETAGEVNIVAMVLIIIVVIALVAIFRSEMTDIVTKMFEKIRAGMEV